MVTSVKEQDTTSKNHELGMDYLGNKVLIGSVITLHSPLCLSRLVKMIINPRFRSLS